MAFRVFCGQSLAVGGPQRQVLATHMPRGAYNSNEKSNAIYILSCIAMFQMLLIF